MTTARACANCLARGWLLAALSGHLDRVRVRVDELLALGDEQLIDAVAGDHVGTLREELEHFDPRAARRRVGDAGLTAICRCDPGFPPALATLENGPRALYVGGELDRCLTLLREAPVAIVGARRASAYGLDTAGSLARGVAASGLTVVSGMAFGIDAAGHEGALAAGGGTVAVLPGPAERAYPAAKRALHRRVIATGAVISELPPGAEIRRWTFLARNRIIAALSAMTVVVEAGHRSGALVTARAAHGLGRIVGAVPGRVTAPQSAGPNALLADGACVVRGPQDVLDAVYGAGARRAVADARPPLEPGTASLLEALASGEDTIEALARAGFQPDELLPALASLELDGYIRRGPGGRFAVMA